MLWLRRDLRLADNPALLAAVQRGGSLLPVALWPEDGGPWPPGAASRWWLWHSLTALDAALRRRGSRLLVEEGPPAETLRHVAAAARAGVVVWAAGLDPAEREDDDAVAAALREAGLEAVVVPPANLLHEPAGFLTAAGRPYTVFTPFWRSLLSRSRPPGPLAAPSSLPTPPPDPPGVPLAALRGRAVRPWAARFGEPWTPGEAGARAASRGSSTTPWSSTRPTATAPI